jgi:hypothetical protein
VACFVYVMVFHCVPGLLQGSVVRYTMSLVPAWNVTSDMKFHSGHKLLTFHQSSKYTWPLSVPPEFFPVLTLVGSLIKSGPGSYQWPGGHVRPLSVVIFKELI